MVSRGIKIIPLWVCGAIGLLPLVQWPRRERGPLACYFSRNFCGKPQQGPKMFDRNLTFVFDSPFWSISVMTQNKAITFHSCVPRKGQRRNTRRVGTFRPMHGKRHSAEIRNPKIRTLAGRRWTSSTFRRGFGKGDGCQSSQGFDGSSK